MPGRPPAGIRAGRRCQRIDGQPVDLIFLLLLPMGGGGADLKALASASGLLRDREKLARLRRAGNAKELY